MANLELGKIRRSAAVTTHGPGAVIDFRTAEGAPVSIVAAGTDFWQFEEQGKHATSVNYTAHEARLSNVLGVRSFRLPPVTAKDEGADNWLSGVRFPDWLQCPSCGRLARSRSWVSVKPGSAGKVCGTCRGEEGAPSWAIPVRFVSACPNGHLDEFPWHHWVGHEKGCGNDGRDLRLRTTGAGLAGLRVECPECNAGRSMESAFGSNALAHLKCRGKRPWLAESDQDCDLNPVVLQRGASNLYFAMHTSALEIPPWGYDIERRLGSLWGPLKAARGADGRRTVMEAHFEDLELDMSLDDLMRRVEHRLGILEAEDSSNLRWGEYLQFSQAEPGDHERLADFETRAEEPPEHFSELIASLVRVVRLREVRALRGFTRIEAYGGSVNVGHKTVPIQPAEISKSKRSWLPALEVRGEGVFLSIDEERLKTWLENSDVLKRSDRIGSPALAAELLGQEIPCGKEAEFTARLLVIHSLAHLLMKQLSLECGYSAASIRERLYVGVDSTPMCGVLIYTATSDSDGTLGGLQRQGMPARMNRIVRDALWSADWCSSDPMCSLERLSLSEENNLAACHSCLLAPETSCEQFNRFLDRTVVIGEEGERDMGIFGKSLEAEE